MVFRVPPDIMTIPELAALDRRGFSSHIVNGISENIDTLAFRDLWPIATNRPWLQTPERLRVISTDVADDAAGAGAQEVIIEGLNLLGLVIQETLPTAGTVLSALTTQFFFRENQTTVGEVGVYGGANVGALTVQTESGIVQANIAPGESESSHVHFTVPSNRTALIYQILPGIDANKAAELRFLLRQKAGQTVPPFSPIRVVFRLPGLVGTVPIEVKIPAFIDGFTDIWFDAKGNAPNTVVSLTMAILLGPGG